MKSLNEISYGCTTYWIVPNQKTSGGHPVWPDAFILSLSWFNSITLPYNRKKKLCTTALCSGNCDAWFNAEAVKKSSDVEASCNLHHPRRTEDACWVPQPTESDQPTTEWSWKNFFLPTISPFRIVERLVGLGRSGSTRIQPALTRNTTLRVSGVCRWQKKFSSLAFSCGIVNLVLTTPLWFMWTFVWLVLYVR